MGASVYNAFAPQERSVADYTNELMQQQQNGLALQTGALGLQEKQRGIADANALRSTVSGFGADKEANYNALLKSGNLKAAQEYQKSENEAKKAGADIGLITAHTGESQLSAGLKKIQAIRDSAAALAQKLTTVDPQNDEHIVGLYQNAVQSGLLSSEQAQAEIQKVPPRGPAREQWKATQQQAGMSFVEQQTKALAAASQAEQARHNRVGEGHQAEQLKVSQGNLAVSRAAESRAASAPKGVYDPERGILVNPRDGTSVPVTAAGAPIGPKEKPEKPLNDAQSKAALFGSRMEASNKVLQSLAGDGTTTSIPGARAGFGIGPTLNVMSSSKQQQLNQAKRDFVNAVLRRESGAVISDSEFDNAEKQYFPQIGDADEVKAQKENNRQIAIRGVQAEVPKASRGVLKEIQGGAAGSWDDADKEARYQAWKAKQK